MPRTKGNKNRPKTNIIKDYASQIVEKQEAIASLNTEIASIQKAIEEQKNTLKEKQSCMSKEVGKMIFRKAEKERMKTIYCKQRNMLYRTAVLRLQKNIRALKNSACNNRILMLI